jgi:flagellar protein FlaI
MLAYLWMLIQYKCNILISGGTASGKTTLLNAISFFIPPEARVVSIEDTRELSLSRENWLPSVSRSSLGIGNIGEVSLFSLLKSSFRQNPDYVIVGEVRGEEASVLFQGMASGHSSLSTIHADSIDTLIKRLETPPINLSPTLINTIDCVAIMAHAIVNKQETRKLREIVEIVEVNPDGIAITNTPFVWNPREDLFYFKKASHVFEKISRRFGFTMEELEKEFKMRTLLLNELSKRKIFNFKEVQEIVNHYFKSPEAVLQTFGITSA